MPVSAGRCTLSSPDNSCLALHHRARLGHVDVPRLVTGRVSTSPYLTVERKEEKKKTTSSAVGVAATRSAGREWRCYAGLLVARRMQRNGCARPWGGGGCSCCRRLRNSISRENLLNKNWAGLVAGSKGSLGRERVAGVGCF